MEKIAMIMKLLMSGEGQVAAIPILIVLAVLLFVQNLDTVKRLILSQIQVL
jgi:hypothetical protein